MLRYYFSITALKPHENITTGVMIYYAHIGAQGGNRTRTNYSFKGF